MYNFSFSISDVDMNLLLRQGYCRNFAYYYIVSWRKNQPYFRIYLYFLPKVL